MDKATIHGVFAFLRDHYWDSLEDQRNILEAHFAACEKQLITLIEGHQAEKPTLSYITLDVPPEVERAFGPGQDPQPLIDFLGGKNL